MRHYKRKTNRGRTPIHLFKLAADSVMRDGRQTRTVARELEIHHLSLSRFIKKLRAGEVPSFGYKRREVFAPDHERLIVDYLSKCASIFFGLLSTEVRRFAYDYAVKFCLPNIPASWHKNNTSGVEWYSNFIRKNSSLPMRIRESILPNACPPTKQNVDIFFAKLGKVLKEHKLPPSRIWNMDEMEVTKMLSPTSEGVVTVVLAANAFGNTLPLMFIFSDQDSKDEFLHDGPPESIGAWNDSGLITNAEFNTFMDHFIKYTKPTPLEPVLLLLDNHASHIDFEVIEKAEMNSVMLLSFPPYCRVLLQPLEVGLNKQFKIHCVKVKDNWIRNHPGKAIAKHEIPAIVKEAWPLTATPVNIMNSFKKAGIYPFDPTQVVVKDNDPVGGVVLNLK